MTPTQEKPTRIDRDLRAHDFAQFARCLALAGGRPRQAVEIAERLGVSSRAVAVCKGAVAAATPGDQSWAKPLVEGLERVVGAFIGSLAHSSAFDRILEDANQLPLGQRAAIATASTTGSIGSPGALKPVSALELDGQVLEAQKAHALAVVANELLEGAGDDGAQLLFSELQRAVSRATDSQFVGALRTAAGGTGAPSSTGTPTDDLAALLDEVTTGDGSSLFWIGAPNVAKRASLLPAMAGRSEMSPTGGSLLNLPFIVSDTLDAGELLLVDASGLAMSGGTVRLTSSEHASLQMDDDPSAGATALVSLWQTNAVGLLVERTFGFELMRDDAVAFMGDVDWSSGVSS